MLAAELVISTTYQEIMDRLQKKLSIGSALQYIRREASALVEPEFGSLQNVLRKSESHTGGPILS
ncbi:hypothetical protein ASF20_19280 [Methylobacterium sp. Leaf88]|nr:hypothetical protein ASF20_19280 [Methylobacterium sp. Leaf88]